LFSNVHKLVQTGKTIPISSSTCEHFFSAMGRLEKLVTHQYGSRKIYLSIEIDLTNKIDGEIILQKFDYQTEN